MASRQDLLPQSSPAGRQRSRSEGKERGVEIRNLFSLLQSKLPAVKGQSSRRLEPMESMALQMQVVPLQMVQWWIGLEVSMLIRSFILKETIRILFSKN